MLDEEAYHELCSYTLAKTDAEFVHQYVVDAYAARHPEISSKPIRIYFALIGLYLHLEKGFTGRRVQLAHMTLAKGKGPWPTFRAPAMLGVLTASDVLKCAEGSDRDHAIDVWCKSVWRAWEEHHSAIASLAAPLLPKSR